MKYHIEINHFLNFPIIFYPNVYRDGQLLYPNRVAAVRASGDIIVTERSPTHQVQIYNQYGQFVRKFGANILQVISVNILINIV